MHGTRSVRRGLFVSLDFFQDNLSRPPLRGYIHRVSCSIGPCPQISKLGVARGVGDDAGNCPHCLLRAVLRLLSFAFRVEKHPNLAFYPVNNIACSHMLFIVL